MKIAVIGATGFVGSNLLDHLLSNGGWEIRILSRDAERARSSLPASITVHQWDPCNALPGELLEGVEAVVNLAGENVADGRWSAQSKRLIRDSRVNTTTNLARCLASLEVKPRVLVNASAIGYYGPRDDKELTEDALPGDDFLAGVCQEWEEAGNEVEACGIRTVLLRIGIVLGKDGGALKKMLLPFRLGLGGPLGNGRQWMSWIANDDLAGLIIHAIQCDSIAGPLNGTAPEPVTNRDFSKALGRSLGRPAFMPMPGFALRLLVGEFADILLTGQRVVPHKALQSNYKFKFPRLQEALQAIVK